MEAVLGCTPAAQLKVTVWGFGRPTLCSTDCR